MHKFRVIKNEVISPSTILLTLRPEDGQGGLRFKAGQYAAIHFKVFGRPTVVRCFSMASSPDSLDLQFALRVTGLFTYTAAFLKVGSPVGVRGPFGDFTLSKATLSHQLFIAGGIGVTPFVSMLRYATDHKLQNRITLIYSVSTTQDAPFVHELIDLERRNPNFHLMLFVTRGGDGQLAGKRVMAGKLTPETLDTLIRDYQAIDYFVCGPATLMRTVQRALRKKGVPEEQIFTEDFTHSVSFWRSLRDSTILKVYAGTAATLAVGLLGIMALDLHSTMAKAEAVSAQSAQPNLNASTPAPSITASATPSRTPVATPDPNQAPVAQSTPVSTPDPTVAPTPDQTQTQTQTQTPAQTYYQPPVSRVS